MEYRRSSSSSRFRRQLDRTIQHDGTSLANPTQPPFRKIGCDTDADALIHDGFVDSHGLD